MNDWLIENADSLKKEKTLFVKQHGDAGKIVRILSIQGDKIELDNFFESDVSIYYVHNKKKNIVDLAIDKLTNNGSTIFTFVAFRQEDVTRSEKRIDLLKKNNKIYIQNFISDYEIAAAIEYNNTKIERASYVFSEALKRYFENVEIYFFHEIMTSVRGKVIQEFKKPMFISNIKEPHLPENDIGGTIPSQVFFKRIKPFARKIDETTICDITVPIMYAGKVPYGFIYVNSKKKYPPAMLEQLNRVAEKLNAQLQLAKIIQPVAERVPVINISYHGIGLFFNNRKLVTIFKPNALMGLQIVLEDGAKPLRQVGYVRNLSSAGKGYMRAGLEFVDLQDDVADYWDGFVSGLADSDDKVEPNK